ncbi:glycosyltransferase 87 family protein [Actinomyces urogenitalis]|uniref:glycosyltransferase 87 family protein n=1 Tax=Actinomyces urogenitalis TaxID=103621 RepID=UPI000AD03449
MTPPSPRWQRWADSIPVQVVAWCAVLLSCYPRLWNKAGEEMFKLDAWIYYHAVAQWQAGGSLYDWWANPDQQLWPFTYPPFAAWAFMPLTWLDDRSIQALLVLATPVCVGMSVWAAARALGASQRRAWALAPWVTLAGVCVIEPVYKSMEYGQVNAILMMLVAVDLLAVPARSPWRGVLSGLAAAFKLTPAIAVIVLLARREWRAAATMTGTAAGVTALCWLISPSESAQFFFSAMWDPGRAGFADYSGNQNLKGFVARWLPEDLRTVVWALTVLGALVGAWLLLRRLDGLRPQSARTGLDEPAGLDGPTRADGPASSDGLTDLAGRRATPSDDGLILTLQVSVAMTLGLLISPISWSHHWVWCVPTLMALMVAARRWDSPALMTAAAAGAAVFVLAMQWWFPEQNHVEQDWPVWASVVGSSYTWWALTTGAALASASAEQRAGQARAERTSAGQAGPVRPEQAGSGQPETDEARTAGSEQVGLV